MKFAAGDCDGKTLRRILEFPHRPPFIVVELAIII